MGGDDLELRVNGRVGRFTAPMSKREKAAAQEGSDPRLLEALAVFKKGDYVRARTMLEPLVTDASRSEGERSQAARLIEATRLDRAIPLTALASLGLLILVALATAFFQP